MAGGSGSLEEGRGGVRWETVVVEDALGLQHSGGGKEPMQRPCKPQVRAGHKQAEMFRNVAEQIRSEEGTQGFWRYFNVII